MAGIAARKTWWGHYWWMLATVLAAVCMIVATISDAKAPAKRKP